MTLTTSVITYPYKYVIIEFDSSFEKAVENLVKNTSFPIIDVDALMDNLFDIIQTDEAYNSASRQSDIDFLLQETFSVGEFDSAMVDSLKECVDNIITSVLSSLHKTGMFINGLQPYDFSRFIDTKTALLTQSKIFSYRDERHPPVNTVPRRDFLL